ncbi:tRNA (adenosine(37)-N6)-threonylcarbamoyltransferase complex ATPase subunit type 1 TsaE [bacterium]|nr:tRNA (adenosine(37)-N6)-threonylcarbamoyltransferase complex ATPase subunit type 1 TsaE [bacterium]
MNLCKRFMTKLNKVTVSSLTELNDFTKSLVPTLKPGTICLLYAEMGAGKTTFVNSFMTHLGVDTVSSPTYTLVNEYHSSPPVYHIDLYRLESDHAVDSFDLDYYFSQTRYIFFVEWSERLSHIDFPHLAISITRENENRLITITNKGL